MRRQLRAYLHGLRVGASDWTLFWTWKSWLGGWMVGIITSIMLWVVLGRMLGSAEQLTFLLVGLGATAGVGSFTTQAATWDRMSGSYALQVITPVGCAAPILGRMSIWAIGWVASAMVTLVALAVVFDWRMPLSKTPFLFLMVVVMSFSALSFTGFLGGFVNRAPAWRNIASGFWLIYLRGVTGAIVPVDFWPGWVQALAAISPVTHSLIAIRLMLDGGPASRILLHVALEIGVGLAWLAATILTFNRLAELGRARGDLEIAGEN